LTRLATTICSRRSPMPRAPTSKPAAARRLYTLGPHAVALALRAAARRISELQARAAAAGVSPSTPSGQRPVYTKPNVATGRGRRRSRSGAKDGHPGHRRPAPPRIDEHREHRLKVCPCCGGPLQRCNRTRTRLIEDLPEDLRSVVTEHTIHRDYCPKCRRHVEPVVPDALPNATFGHRLVSFASWCHYGLGVTLDPLIDILAVPPANQALARRPDRGLATPGRHSHTLESKFTNWRPARSEPATQAAKGPRTRVRGSDSAPISPGWLYSDLQCPPAGRCSSISAGGR